MYVVVVEEGPSKGSSLVLEEGDYTFGRSRENDLCLSDDSLSRHHFRIALADGVATLFTLGTETPVRVNGEPVTTAVLKPGSQIEAGASVLLLDVEAFPPHPDHQAPIVDRSMEPLCAEYPSRAGLAPDAGTLARAALDREILYEASLALARSQTEKDLRQALVELALRGASADRVLLFAREDAQGRWLPSALAHVRSDSGGGGVDRGRAASASSGTSSERSLKGADYSRTVLYEAIRTEKALLCSQVPHDPRFGHAESVLVLGIQSVIVVPIILDGEARAALYADVTMRGRRLDADDLSLLTALANQAAVSMRRLREHQDLSTAHRTLTRRLRSTSTMVATSPEMVRVMDLLERVARTDATVLIRGESGTGKELAASYVHDNSSRAQKPFVAINCASLSRELAESELFGHVRGAFTGAIEARDGRFLEAHTGTLFLDEIGEMDLSCQAKVLRALEMRQISPVGSQRTVPVDVRILAGTNRDLEEGVRTGGFRKDLYFRLRVVEVLLTPLRQRTQEIPELVARFIDEFNRKLGKKVRGFQAAALEVLLAHPWPGNVRELKNTVEMAMILCDEEEIGTADLSHYLARTAPASSENSPLSSLADVERAHILRVLRHTAGVKAQAARILGIDKKTLYAKLEAYTTTGSGEV